MLKFAKLSPDRRVSMGLAARRKAELEFGEQRVIDSYIAALERILGDRTPGNGGAQ
jgi:hypothetical protein